MNLPFSDELLLPIQYLFYPIRPVVSTQEAELNAEGMHVDGRRLEGAELELLAQRDGFATAADFLAFFVGRPLPIVGQLIHWTPAHYEAATVATIPARLAELAAERLALTA